MLLKLKSLVTICPIIYKQDIIKHMDIKNLKQLLALLIAILIMISGLYYKYDSDKKAVRYYSQGVNLFNQDKYSDAYYNFKKIRPVSKLYEISLLKQYQCAKKLDDKKTALIKLKEIIKKSKNEHIKPWALYNEAILSQELKQNNDSLLYKKFKTIHEKYPKNDFAIASAYKSAQLSKDLTPNTAKENFIEYLSYAPNGKFALNAIEELSNLSSVFNKDDYEIIANAKLANEHYKNALEYYQKTNFSKNWYKISKCYKGLNDSINEKQVIEKGLKLTYSEVTEKEISIAIDRLISLNRSNKLQLLQELYTNYPNSYIFPTIAYKLAEISNSIRAIKLYEMIAKDYPNSIWASNSLWEIFWYNYQESRYKVCEKIATKHIRLYKDSQDAPRISYWYARALLKSRKNQQAREMFYDVINNYPLSYYAFLSAKQLKKSKANKMIVKKTIEYYDIKILNKLIFEDNILLKLADLGDWELIEEFKINNDYIKSWILYQKENYPLAINFAKEELLRNKNTNIPDEKKSTISLSDQMLKLAYPIFYQNEINHYAQEFKQSPYLFLSLIREESHFNEKATSPAGAEGLCQLMNTTVDFIEKKPTSNETLFNAEENIRIGLKYFDYLTNQFKKNEYLAILAYNAGPGNVNKWLNDPKINFQPDEIETLVENIPFIETKTYIKKILSSYWVYLNIYSAHNKTRT